MRFVLVCFSLLPLMVIGARMDSIRSENREEGMFIIHEVEEEETLFSIARRYNSSINSIIKFNSISDNRIEIGQIISVLVEEREKTDADGKVHIVEEGETLYTISRKYGLKVRELKKLNNLEDNNISLGQRLVVSEDEEEEAQSKVEERTVVVELDSTNSDSLSNEKSLIVQTGETLRSIALRLGVTVDELKDWNGLTSDYLAIGQRLIYKETEREQISELDSTATATRINEEGFERTYEEGIAALIERTSTSKYLALHRELPIGTEIEVRNLMNNLVVHVKVVGKLPDTGLNRNLLLRLSKPAYDQLGILDPKARVEVSYFKE